MSLISTSVETISLCRQRMSQLPQSMVDIKINNRIQETIPVRFEQKAWLKQTCLTAARDQKGGSRHCHLP